MPPSTFCQHDKIMNMKRSEREKEEVPYETLQMRSSFSSLKNFGTKSGLSWLALQIQRLSLTCPWCFVDKICWGQVLRTPAAWFLCHPKHARRSLEVNELCVSWEITYAGFVWALNGNSCIPVERTLHFDECHRNPQDHEQGFLYQKTPHERETEESQKMSKQKVSKQQQQQKKPKQAIPFWRTGVIWKVAWVLLTHPYTLIFSLSSLWWGQCCPFSWLLCHAHYTAAIVWIGAMFCRHLVLSKTSIRHLFYTKVFDIWSYPNPFGMDQICSQMFWVRPVSSTLWQGQMT